MSSNDIYIYDAIRTPRGKGRAAQGDKPGGSLSNIAPQELVAGLVNAMRRRCPEFESHVAGLTLGCVGQVGAQGGHMALVSRLASDLPNSISVQTLNNHCISSLSATRNSVQHAAFNSGKLYLSGGVECLSQVAFLADQAHYYSDPATRKALKWAPPIMGAELIATLEQFSKQDLDEVTLLSHQRAGRAWNAGVFERFVEPVVDPAGKVVLARDELIRDSLSLEQLTAMPPAFAEQGQQGFDEMMLNEYSELEKINHLHSVANCPGMADGASLILLGDQQAGSNSGLRAKARVVAMAETAGDPTLQLTAGMLAMEQVLSATNMQIDDFDRIEFMEAFAAVPVKFIRDYQPDIDKVNVNGGHLAMGHPMGATGGILVSQLSNELSRCDGEMGLVVGTAGGGLGSAMIIQRVA